TFMTSGTNPVTGTFTWTPSAGTGGQSFPVMFSASDGHNPAVTATTTANVAFSPVSFFGGKLSWTHHLSLAENSNMQTWTAKLANPNSVTVYAQVTIVGTDGTGTTGFTTISSTFTLTGGASITPTITQTFPATDIGVKFHFTATIMWGTSPTALTSPGGNTKTGSFTIVS
ncbi:MAG TPA: hypothetical protein VNA15_06195, partial [Candidatus Angelobacter sp.]|nr:hypothetical protein [Candidatus Angelobacter sp.]